MSLFPSTTLFPSTILFPQPGPVLVPTVVQQATLAEAGITGTVEAACDTTNGNVVLFNNGATVWLELTNTSGVTQTVTITIPFTVKGQPIPGPVITLPAGGKHRRGPFDATVYGSTLQFLASSAAVTVAAYQYIPPR